MEGDRSGAGGGASVIKGHRGGGEGGGDGEGGDGGDGRGREKAAHGCTLASPRRRSGHATSQ